MTVSSAMMLVWLLIGFKDGKATIKEYFTRAKVVQYYHCFLTTFAYNNL